MATYRKRDQHEKHLDTLKMQIELSEQDRARRKVLFDKHLTKYQDWKVTNKINGIKF